MNAPLWISSDIALITGGRATDPFSVTGSVSIDTRSLKPGDLFVALTDQRDGHDFVEAAFAAGAAGALVSRQVGLGPQLVADDVQEALEQMGVAARVRCGAHRTAVTGSAGKTSVKEMLAQIYRAFGPAHWNVKSFNNHWGVPLMVFEGEAFFGQDRLDVLEWRLEQSGVQRRSFKSSTSSLTG